MNRTKSGCIFAALVCLLASGLLAGTCLPAAAQSAPGSADAAGHRQDNGTLLKQIANYERQIVQGGGAQQAAQPARDNRRLADAQQEALLSEVLRLRRQIKVLEADKKQVQPADAPAPDDREIRQLKTDLDKERQRYTALEKELSRLKEDQETRRAETNRVKRTAYELQGDRVRAEKLEKELKDLQARYDQVKAEAAKGNAFREKLVSTSKAAEQLELELQAKRKNEADNQFLRTEVERINAEKAKLDAKLQESSRGTGALEKDVGALKQQLAAKDDEILGLKRQLSKTIEDVKECGSTVSQKDRALDSIPALENQLSQLRTQVAEGQKQIQACSSELDGSKQIISEMGKLREELLAAKNELMLRDVEPKLAGEVGQKGRPGTRGRGRPSSGAAPMRDKSDVRTAQLSAPAANPGDHAAAVRPTPAAVDPGVMTVEVVAPKANLRSGAGEENSPVMQVARGARLVVEAREGDWFRVISPTGGRAYILNEVVRVLTDGDRSDRPSPAFAGDMPGAAATGTLGGPRKPPVRVGQDGGAGPGGLEPFGGAQFGVRSGPRDSESLALEQARTMGMRGRAPQ